MIAGEEGSCSYSIVALHVFTCAFNKPQITQCGLLAHLPLQLHRVNSKNELQLGLIAPPLLEIRVRVYGTS